MARTDEQARSAGDREVGNGHSRGDRLQAPHTAADRPRPWSHEDLRQRLERLPRGHPSSPCNADGSRKPPPPNLRALELAMPDARERARRDQSESPAPALEPLTDAEHAEHVTQVRELLDQARESGLATDRGFVVDHKRGLWSDERDDIHTEILNYLYAKADDVPCEHRAVMAGGLPGAGKTTVLESKAGIDCSQYLTINPDDVKEEMARRGLIPQVDELSPMEASELVHEESSYLAKRLALRAMGDGKNLIWDITMASRQSTERRLTDLDRAGYVTTGIFVDIPVEVGIRRTDERYREGNENYRNGRGEGGRYVPPEVIISQENAEWVSTNRYTFETLKYRFEAWAMYDNSVDGRAAQTLASGSRAQEPREEG